MATWKDTARAATTANITLSGTQTIDGVKLAVNDRVLVKNQATPSQNGLYVVAASAWSRTSDTSTTSEPEMAVRVSEGNVNAHSAWVLTIPSPITVGSTALTYQRWPCSGFYHLDASSAALAAGDWVAPLPSDPTKVTRATPMTALAAGAVVGCVDTTYSPGAKNVLVRRLGDVVAASVFSDLGAGTVARLQMNTRGRTIRQPHFSGGEIKLGTVDANGNVTVETFVPLDRSPQHEYNPKTYGAVADGQLDNNLFVYGTDDTPAWNAMMAAIAADPLPGKKKIRLPAGLMYMAGDSWTFGTRKVEVAASVHIEGNGGAGVNASTGLSNSGFLLPQLTQLVFCNRGASSTGTGDAKYSHAEYFNMHTIAPIISTGFARSVYSTMDASFNRAVYSASRKAVPKGLCVAYSGATVSTEGASKTDSSGTRNDVMFRANCSFVPTGGEPTAFSTADPNQIGTVIPDGTGSWTVESVPKDRNIFSGAAVRAGQRFLVPGDVRYIFEVVTAGTLARDTTGTCGGSTAGWLGRGSPYIQPAPWQQFSDGTARVRAMSAGTLLALANECVYQHLVLEGGIGSSIQVEGGSLDGIATAGQPNWAVADYNVVNDVRAFFSHGGVSFHGAECNVGRVNHCRVDTPSSLQRSKPHSIPAGLADMGDGSFCVHQRHLGGNYVTACYYASGLGVGFVSDSSAGSTQPGMPDPIQPASQTQFLECRVEGTSKANIINANGFYVTVEAQQGIDDRCAATQVGPGRTRYIVGHETDPITSKTTNYGLQTSGLSTILSYFLRIGQDATKGAYTGFWTEKVGSLTFQNGWIAYGQGPNSSILGIPRVAWGASFGDAKTTGKLISNFPAGYPKPDV
jgi:hypothetical protein